MTEFIIFLVGLLLGGCVGVIVMCLVQINRLYNNNSNGKDVGHNEKKNG